MGLPKSLPVGVDESFAVTACAGNRHVNGALKCRRAACHVALYRNEESLPLSCSLSGKTGCHLQVRLLELVIETCLE